MGRGVVRDSVGGFPDHPEKTLRTNNQKGRPVIVAPLTGLDAAFLSLEGDGAPMHMGALAVFSPSRPARPDRLRALLAERAGRIARLRQRVKTGWHPLGGTRWVEDPIFDAREHVHTQFLHGVDRHAEFTQVVARLMARPLDGARPLWEAHVITGMSDDRFGVLVKLHHALTDGAGAVGLAAGLLDGFADGEQVRPAHREPVFDGLISAVRQAARLITSPHILAKQAAATAHITTSLVRHGRPAALARSMAAAPSHERTLAIGRLDRDVLLRIRKLHGGTTNDAVLGVLAGAWRRWLVEHDLPTGPEAVCALIPVSVRGRRAGGGNNQLSGYLCELPVAEPDPAAQLRAVRSRMDANKRSGPGRGAGAFPLLADQVPAALHQMFGPILRRSAGLLFDTVVTNVPLPNVPLHLDGAELREVYPIVPLAHGHQLAVGISNYRDTVHIGLHGGASGPGDLARLAAALPTAAAALEDAEPAA